MATQIKLGEIVADVVLKDIKNVHLSVYPPTGKVRISAPMRMDLDTIRVYALSKLGWIKRQQEKLRAQERETPREFLDRESHYVWGKRYLLKVVKEDSAPTVVLEHGRMLLQVRPGTTEGSRQAILDKWYRDQLKDSLPPLLEKWELIIGERVERYFIRAMKTRWGSCTPAKRSIRLNTDLAKKPRECLEYVVVHEMVHFLERSHNNRFVSLMDGFMPNWRFHRDVLNRLPVRHENWIY